MMRVLTIDRDNYTDVTEGIVHDDSVRDACVEFMQHPYSEFIYWPGLPGDCKISNVISEKFALAYPPLNIMTEMVVLGLLRPARHNENYACYRWNRKVSHMKYKISGEDHA